MLGCAKLCNAVAGADLAACKRLKWTESNQKKMKRRITGERVASEFCTNIKKNKKINNIILSLN